MCDLKVNPEQGKQGPEAFRAVLCLNDLPLFNSLKALHSNMLHCYGSATAFHSPTFIGLDYEAAGYCFYCRILSQKSIRLLADVNTDYSGTEKMFQGNKFAFQELCIY